MGSRMFWSADAKAVEARILADFPGAWTSFDECLNTSGVKTVSVSITDARLHGTQVAQRCVLVYRAATRASSKPVSVTVRGNGAIAFLDRNIETAGRRLNQVTGLDEEYAAYSEFGIVELASLQAVPS